MLNAGIIIHPYMPQQMYRHVAQFFFYIPLQIYNALKRINIQIIRHQDKKFAIKNVYCRIVLLHSCSESGLLLDSPIGRDQTTYGYCTWTPLDGLWRAGGLFRGCRAIQTTEPKLLGHSLPIRILTWTSSGL